MSSMWNYEEPVRNDPRTPLEIVEEQCRELARISGGRVIARVTEYDGPYESVKNLPGTRTRDGPSPTKRGFDVQDVMGDKAVDDDYDNRFVYELFVTSKKTPRYRYRIFIMYHGIDVYPVGLTLQEDIAEETGIDSEGTRLAGPAMLTHALGRILGSAALGKVLGNLASLNRPGS